MNDLVEARHLFLASKQQRQAHALQLAALQLTCGLDLAATLASGDEERAAGLLRVERMLERERLKGQNRHWSYDLNRHIALKQVCDTLRASLGDPEEQQASPKQNGARRRRS